MAARRKNYAIARVDGTYDMVKTGTALAVIVASNIFIDLQAALCVQRVLYQNRYWLQATRDLPDLLLGTAIIVTLGASICYALRVRRKTNDAVTAFALLVACATPASFLFKDVAKFIFGRISTREWLLHPSLYGYHWFNGGGEFFGFPSGHMAVFTTLAAAYWRIFPRHRALCLLSLSLLGIVLVASNYHFVSDVLAGAGLGLAIEAGTFQLLRRRLPSLYRALNGEVVSD